MNLFSYKDIEYLRKTKKIALLILIGLVVLLVGLNVLFLLIAKYETKTTYKTLLSVTNSLIIISILIDLFAVILPTRKLEKLIYSINTAQDTKEVDGEIISISDTTVSLSDVVKIYGIKVKVDKEIQTYYWLANYGNPKDHIKSNIVHITLIKNYIKDIKND